MAMTLRCACCREFLLLGDVAYSIDWVGAQWALALALFVAWVGTDDAHDIVAAYNPAIFAETLDGGSDFHGASGVVELLD